MGEINDDDDDDDDDGEQKKRARRAGLCERGQQPSFAVLFALLVRMSCVRACESDESARTMDARCRLELSLSLSLEVVVVVAGE